VLVSLDPTDIGFIDFDNAAKLLKIGAASFAQPMKEEPSRLLRDVWGPRKSDASGVAASALPNQARGSCQASGTPDRGAVSDTALWRAEGD
jgi:hypothetical protein